MAIEHSLETLQKKVLLREKQLAELHKKHTDLSERVQALDKRTEIRPVLLKEVSTKSSMTKTIVSEVIKASMILVVTIYLNRMLTKQRIEAKVEKEVEKKVEKKVVTEVEKKIG